MNRPTGGKGGAVYPSPLRTRCQECHDALVVIGTESFADRLPASARFSHPPTSSRHPHTDGCPGGRRLTSSSSTSPSSGRPFSPTSQTQESYSMLSETDFQKEKQKIEEEEKKLRADIEEAEKQYSEVISEMKDLETKSKQFKELKEQYWQEFNSFWFQRTSHQEEQDAILAKIEVFQAHLELLKHTNVLNDAFYISQHGVFGTINNLCLGHPHEVEWDEINAAWGQVALLLHIMAQHFTPKFQYRIKIHAVGSYPRITDINNKTYKLFGPANVLFSTQYDDAMTWFLRCLQEFVEFAVSLDKENNVPPDKSLEIPYKIDGDKIGGYRVVLGDFNTKENSTKALNNMLFVLKRVLYWFIDLPPESLQAQTSKR